MKYLTQRRDAPATKSSGWPRPKAEPRSGRKSLRGAENAEGMGVVPVNVRLDSTQPCSPLRLGAFGVHATARHTRVCLRVAVLPKSPKPRSLRPAGGIESSRVCHPVGIRRGARDTARTVPAQRRYRAASGRSRGFRSPYASRCGVGGYAAFLASLASGGAIREPRPSALLRSASPSLPRLTRLAERFLRSLCGAAPRRLSWAGWGAESMGRDPNDSLLDQNVRHSLARSPFWAGEDIARVCSGLSREALAAGHDDASGETFTRLRFAPVADETPAWLGASPGGANATPRRDNARRSVSPRMARELTLKVAAARGADPAAKAERARKCHARLDSAPQAERPPRIEASSAGLRPEDILVYVERSKGRRNRPTRGGQVRLRRIKPHADKAAPHTTPPQKNLCVSQALALKNRKVRAARWSAPTGGGGAGRTPARASASRTACRPGDTAGRPLPRGWGGNGPHPRRAKPGGLALLTRYFEAFKLHEAVV